MVVQSVTNIKLYLWKERKIRNLENKLRAGIQSSTNTQHKLDQMALFCFCHNLCSWNLQSLKLVLETKIPLSQLIVIDACGFICSISYPQ